MASEIIKQFVEEATEHLQEAERLVLQLEKDVGDLEAIRLIFQHMHSIKGISDYTNMESINLLSHELESLLNMLRKERIDSSPEIVDLILKGLDMLKDCLAHPNAPEHNKEEALAFADLIREKIASGKNTDGEESQRKPPAPDAKLAPQKMAKIFKNSALQHLNILRGIVQKLEEDPGDENALQVLERTLNTMCAAAAYVGLHEAEDLLGETIAQNDPDQVNPDELTSFIEEYARLLETFDSEPESAGSKPVEASAGRPSNDEEPESPSPFTADRTLRVSISKLDNFMNQIAELVLVRNSLEHVLLSLETNRPDQDIARQMRSTSRTLNKIIEQLHKQVMSIRLVPALRLYERFPRYVRDIAREHGKEIRLKMLGEDTELDKNIIEILNDPLMHMLRNSVAHGIEDAETRRKRGKTDFGNIVIKALQEGNMISLEVIDDGQGIDADRIRERAVQTGVITPEEARTMTESEIVRLIFRPGFTTAEGQNLLSGRGVGLDVVVSNVTRAGGNVFIEFEKGQGTRFIIKIPITLAVVEALIVQSAENRYAVPTGFIQETIDIPREKIIMVNNRKTILFRNEVTALFRLAELMEDRRSKEDFSALPESLTAVILNINNFRLGLLIDGIIQKQDILIKPLHAALSEMRCFSGAAILGDGELALILNPAGLIKEGRI